MLNPQNLQEQKLVVTGKHIKQENSLIVNCDKITLNNTKLELKVDVPTTSVKSIDKLVINGVEFIKNSPSLLEDLMLD